MIRRLPASVVAVFVALGLAACTPAPPSSIAQSNAPKTTTTTLSTTDRLMAEAQQFAYRVRNANCDATGSSFATTKGIVTNRHVASGSESLQLSTWSGNDFNANVQSISQMPGPDLALLDEGSTSAPAVLDPNNVPAGTPVWAAGYPEGNQLTLTPGIVVDYIDGNIYGSPGQIMELTNAVEPGNSGSPLLDSEGQVVGVVFALNTVTGNGLAIPVSTLNQYLAAPGANTEGACLG